MRTGRSLAGALALWGLVWACTPALEPAKPVPAPPADADSIELALFLIGDAGSKAYDGEPVLHDLSRQSDSLRPARQFVIFLGDNVYPRGVPPEGHPYRDDAERKIAAQVLAIRRGAAQGLMIPGNHDWDRQGRDGWNSIRRQDTLVRRYGGRDVRVAPRGGCPGPDVVDLGEHVRLIALDTEWWVHNDTKPFGANSPCPTRTYQEVTDSLAGAIRDRGKRYVVVLTHHPIRSGGEHGGAFKLTDHIFPLRNVQSWMWLPLPIIGSIYPLARKWGVSNQDISGSKYKAMRRSFEAVFQKYPPLVYAAGHDHNLQVIRGGRPEVSYAKYILVSGAGILGHASLVRHIEGTLSSGRPQGSCDSTLPRTGAFDCR